jgi:hypothetical protein
MATITDAEYTYNTICPAIVDTLRSSWQWDSIVDEIEITYITSNTQTSKFTVFYVDTAKTLGIAVGIDAYVVGIILNGEINYIRDVGYNDAVLHTIQNNSAFYFAVYSGSSWHPSSAPIGFSVCDAVSQDGNKDISQVLCTFSYSNDQYSEYRVYSPKSDTPVIRTYPIITTAPYMTLLPLIGSVAGVTAGLYYTLMNEYAVTDLKTIHMNNKTFYICGNAALIDTYTG